jgi:DNA (cytosine-5)-methyltransferase 1
MIYATLKHQQRQICGYVFRCPNMAVQEADDSDPEDSEDYCLLSENATSEITFASSHKGIRVRDKRDVRWVGSHIKDDGRRKYYK